MVEKYCEGIDCQYCSEKEPCIYKIANRQAEIIEEIKEIANNVYDPVDKENDACFHILQIIQKCEENNVNI